MPFARWPVDPVLLCRRLPDEELAGAANRALANCIRQLAAVARVAQGVFEEVGAECRALADRTDRLGRKVTACRDAVAALDARARTVPVSDVERTTKQLRTQRPYATRYEASASLFVPGTRPPCVDRLYAAAATGPVLGGAPQRLVLTPVLGGPRRRRHPRKMLLDIETRKPADVSLSRDADPPLPGSACSTLRMATEMERLPSPEEQAMMLSLEFPSRVVPVDTSGNTFTRMSLLRRSLIHVDFVIKRQKSKRGKSGVGRRRHSYCEADRSRDASCQTDAPVLRSPSRRALDPRRRTAALDDLHLDAAAPTPLKEEPARTKGSGGSVRRSLLTGLSAALHAVKMRRAGGGRHPDDGRSSSGNWSASSSTRASVESADPPLPRPGSGGEEEECGPAVPPSPTPADTPLVRSPFAVRKGISDDGDSSVYSVDADGYYTSMHTDSGLGGRSRQRRESQSSVSTLGNSSVNSFLSQCSTPSPQRRRGPPPPPPPRRSPPSDAEDRIRAKTAITALRYPSLCPPVSPATSDDDELWAPGRFTVSAEVHREPGGRRPVPMYRSETPERSCFASGIAPATSTPRSDRGVTSFAPDTDSSVLTESVDSGSTVRGESDADSVESVVVTERPVAVRLVPPKSLIPLKYAQRITVTPIARTAAAAAPQPRQEMRSGPCAPIPPCASPVRSPSRIPAPRSVARVTLDPAGRVVYASNSLDRTAHAKSPTEPRFATLPRAAQHNAGPPPISTPTFDPPANRRGGSGSAAAAPSLAPTPSPGVPACRDFSFRPSRGGRFCRSYFPSHLISRPPTDAPDSRIPVYNVPISTQSRAPPTTGAPYRGPAYHTPGPVSGTRSSTYRSPPDPGARSYWPNRSVYRRETMASYSPAPKCAPTPPPDVIPSGESPPSTLDITSETKSALSASELFAIIHRSKKRLNLKPAAESCGPARSPGRAPSKPTSMHDFKMLLLQTRSEPSGRPSAAELLKVTTSPVRGGPRTTQGGAKRGVRLRSPYLSRFDASYPPILEDCSEETADAPPPASTWV